MIINTSTRIAPIVNVSTYDGPFSYESLWEDDEREERDEGNFVCDDYSHAKLGEAIVEEANRVFDSEKPLAKYGVSRIHATAFGSPREYNFMTDWLDLRVRIVKRKFFRLAKKAVFDPKNRAKIVGYAGENWVSYDGFCSSMLNRISNLSRDYWKHTHYGTHMATDKEVEDALLADLEEAFDHLENGTGDDDFREFGAILALLWLIEYPGDFERCGESPIYGSWITDESSIYGSWVTDEMMEAFRGHRFLGDFCTILKPGDLDRKVADALIDFDAYRTQVKTECDKYLKCGVGEASQAKAKNWLEAVLKKVDEWESKQRGRVELYAPEWDKVRKELDELREEWDARLKVGWKDAWK